MTRSESWAKEVREMDREGLVAVLIGKGKYPKKLAIILESFGLRR
jgi:hypothetical protein